MNENFMIYSNIKKVKQKVLICFILMIFASWPYIGYFVSAVALLVQFLICYDLHRLSKSITLLKNAKIALAISVVSLIVGIVFEILNIRIIQSEEELLKTHIVFTFETIFLIVWRVVSFSLFWFFMYFIYKELSFITDQKFLFLAYVLSVLSIAFIAIFVFIFSATNTQDSENIAVLLFCFFGIFGGLILGLSGIILQIIGWINFKNLRNSQTGEWIFRYEWLFIDKN